jgi:hypothetical protein
VNTLGMQIIGGVAHYGAKRRGTRLALARGLSEADAKLVGRFCGLIAFAVVSKTLNWSPPGRRA